MKKVNIGLIGAGTIGSGVIAILRDSCEQIKKRSGLELVLHTVCDIHVNTLSVKLPDETRTTNNFQEVVSSPDIDLVVELIGGTKVAYQVAKDALEHGKTLVTANKALISEKGEELFFLANQNGAEIGYEAAVGGTIPIIRSMKTGLISNHYHSIYGILNGTTNFILSRMETEGLDYRNALKQAQELGFAEKDPTFDVEGIDAAHKISILGGLAFGKKIPIDKIYIEGISKISAVEIKTAKELGYRIKLLGVCKSQGDKVEARVHPTMVPLAHPIASVMNEMNAVFFETNYSGPVMLVGKGAGSLPTAAAVISDIVYYSARVGNNARAKENNFSDMADLVPIGENIERFYIRFNTIDEPGVLGEITNILGRNHISISSVRQLESKQEPVQVVIITHPAQEAKLRRAIDEIDTLEMIKERSVIIRLEKLS
jgi:homoserine dehydrogenase